MEERRELLREGRNSEYVEVVKEMLQREEHVFGQTFQEIMEHMDGLTQ